jgi:hypothetical protein
MDQALIVFKKFNANMNNPIWSELKTIDIFEVYDDPKGPYNEESLTHCTIATSSGQNKKAVSDSDSLGFIKRKITPHKLSYSQLSWFELGQNAKDIIKNMAKLPLDEVQKRLEVAMA